MSGSVSLIDGHIDEVRICPICGKEFTPSFNRQQKYCCAECAKIAKKLKAKEYYKWYYLQHKMANSEPLLEPRVTVKSRPLDTLSGDELLHYSSVQQKMNANMFSVTIS